MDKDNTDGVGRRQSKSKLIAFPCERALRERAKGIVRGLVGEFSPMSPECIALSECYRRFLVAERDRAAVAARLTVACADGDVSFSDPADCERVLAGVLAEWPS